jgi:nucleotide-binding universal stress UspA family protein
MPGRRQNPHFRRILAGYDGSVQAEKAVDVAIYLAESLDATVLVFAVARPPEPATSVEVEAVLDDAREHYEQGFVTCDGKRSNRRSSWRRTLLSDTQPNRLFTAPRPTKSTW